MIKISNGVVRNPLVCLDQPINIQIDHGEHIAVVGPNGAGKTLFVETLLGKYPLKEGQLEYDFSPSVSQTVYDNIKYITFRDTYGASDANYYYQQRWNSTDQEDVPTVREQLGEVDDKQLCQHFFRLFNMESLLDKKIILLSSGELRKFQLIKALLSTPRVLIIDNPFIGLDAEARDSLNMLLEELSGLEYLQIILVLSIPADIPRFVTHVIPVCNKVVGKKTEANAYRPEEAVNPPCKRLYAEAGEAATAANAEVVRLNKVSIRYGNRTILNELDWTIRQGEKWALSGENGSGKSTLLSLLCADNPQSYACDISLFGRKRGTGESIWDIKKRIGYVSPEMHRAYLKNIPAIEIVASGLHDSIGLYRRPQAADLSTCETWMDTFGIGALKERPFLQLSSGEQRLVLLVRAFVKDPELLILDEPLHGLDTANRRLVKKLIESYCERQDKTLIMVTHYEEELPQLITHHLRLQKHAEG